MLGLPLLQMGTSRRSSAGLDVYRGAGCTEGIRSCRTARGRIAAGDGRIGCGGGGVAASVLAAGGAAQAMRVEGETLSAFKRRVDELLRNLEKSKAAPKSIANGSLPSGRLGAFDEADSLYSAYTHVHRQLENLSKMLALQIEGLVVTVDAAKTGYDDLDADVRARLSRIRTQADALSCFQPDCVSARLVGCTN